MVIETVRAPGGAYPVVIGAAMEDVSRFSGQARLCFVSDATVARLYRHHFPVAAAFITIEAGERKKTLASVADLYDHFLDLQVDPSWCVVGVGGGVVCDVVGFAAATFRRGIPCAFIATTLLAQADAAVGGKNGVNLQHYKNMVGTIRQPRFVLCDLDALATLPADELANGFAEIIKHGVIASSSLCEFLETQAGRLLTLEREPLQKVLRESIAIKAGVVERDENESHERKKLNFGHTFAHALENRLKISHGQAVSIGMVLAAKLSVKLGRLDAAALERLIALLGKFNLPVTCELSVRKLLDPMRLDKKRRGADLDLVLLDELGRAVIVPTPMAVLEEMLK
jgi:3-dehydroquinate synthase